MRTPKSGFTGLASDPFYLQQVAEPEAALKACASCPCPHIQGGSRTWAPGSWAPISPIVTGTALATHSAFSRFGTRMRKTRTFAIGCSRTQEHELAALFEVVNVAFHLPLHSSPVVSRPLYSILLWFRRLIFETISFQSLRIRCQARTREHWAFLSVCAMDGPGGGVGEGGSCGAGVLLPSQNHSASPQFRFGNPEFTRFRIQLILSLPYSANSL